ncbi:MAG: exonuclease domain-containing protein [Lachnospiraceae bacterium]|nr:exonuclease domain-containing protein [Lachnospiraceae bacterium]
MENIMGNEQALKSNGHFAMIDLEMCRVPRKTAQTLGMKHEIIQIGAVLLNADYEIIDRFNRYVRPVYGQLDDFIKELTGITEKDLAGAGSFEAVLQDFTAWIPADATMISWSMSDRKQLKEELGAKQLTSDVLTRLFETWIDCQPMFAEKLNSRRRYSLQEALVAADIKTQGNAHDGLSDAYNTALLFAKMMTSEVFTLNEYFRIAHEDTEPEPLVFSMGDLFAGIDFSSLAIA